MYFGHTFAEVEQKVKFKDKMKTNINKLSKCQGYRHTIQQVVFLNPSWKHRLVKWFNNIFVKAVWLTNTFDSFITPSKTLITGQERNPFRYKYVSC